MTSWSIEEISEFFSGDVFAVEARREFSIKNCLRLTSRTDPITRQKVYAWHRCKNFRECENCAQLRADNEVSMWEEFPGSLKTLTVSSGKEAAKLAKKLDLYRRYPVGDEIVFVFGDEDIYGDPVPQDDMEDFALHITHTTPGKRITGRLVHKDAPADDECQDGVNVYIPVVVFDNIEDRESVEALNEIAIDNTTPESMPETQEELQGELDRLFNEETRLYKAAKISYGVLYSINTCVDLSKLKWQIASNSRHYIAQSTNHTGNPMQKEEFDRINDDLFGV